MTDIHIDPLPATAATLALSDIAAPVDIAAVWGGASGTVTWAAGEGLMVVGPDGVGKTTLAQQLTLGAIGLRSRVLGMRVALADRPVLYLAMDRPAQVVRSFRRMVTEENRDVLRERLLVWKGPLPFNITESPSSLARFVREHGAGVLFVDSLKDVAVDLIKDEVGSRVNQAVQELLADGVEVCLLHHQRKQQAASGSPKPTRLADVYGSRWLTAGRSLAPDHRRS
jgi:replicative DNA helicase